VLELAQAIAPFVLKTPHLIAKFDNQGAVLDELSVIHENEEILMIESTKVRPRSFYIEGMGHHWSEVERTPTGVRYATRSQVFAYEKAFSLDPARHVLKFKLTVKNLSDKEQAPKIEMFALNGIHRDSDYRYDSYLTGFWGKDQGDHIEFTHYPWSGTLTTPSEESGIAAVGLKSRYFALALMPESMRVKWYWPQGMGQKELEEAKEFRNIKMFLGLAPVAIPPKNSTTYAFDLYAGPIRHRELSETKRPLTDLFDPVGPNFVGEAILGLLVFFFGIFKSFGFAIIFTTLVVRLSLFYLNKKSQVSLYRMSQLSPKLEALKAKHKDDPQKMSQEQWKLFREEKINPAAGCLPMFIQLPILIALWSVFEIAVDMRRQPFLWFDDLSQPDRLIPFGGKIFWEVDSLNLLPILMTIVWVIQSMMAPKSKDPQMQMNQKMMQIMPVFFGVLCYNLAAGLSWYMLVSALLGILEQKIIKKYFLPKAKPAT
jgi:YidC/Oxa1 family membrane protein insertase